MIKRALQPLVILALAGCNSSTTPDAPKSGVRTVTSLIVAINPVPVSAPLYIAQERGFFAEEGLKVEFKPFPTGKQCLDAVLGGAAQLGTVAELPVVRALAAGKSPTILATFEASDRHIKIVSKRPIAEGKALAGLRVGVPVGTSAEFFLLSLLEKSGLSASAVKVVNLRPPDMPAAFRGNQVDAVCIWEPSAINSEKAVPGAIRKSFPGIYTETFNIVARREDLGAQSKAYQGFLRALAKANAFANRDPSASDAIVAKATNVDAALLGAFKGDLTFMLDTPKELKEMMAREAAWLKKDPSGSAPAQGAINGSIDTKLLQAAVGGQ